MKKTVIILSLMLSHLGFSQITESGVTSTASAAGDHAFVGTKSDGVFSNWLNTGYSATAYNLLGFSNQHAGFGVADGNNIVSPIVWMYANDRNAFRVRTINFNTNLTSGTDLFTVRANGNVGIGTTAPQKKLHINAVADDGIALGSGNALLGENGLGSFAQLLFWNGTNAYYGRSALGAGVSNHYFRTNGTDRMFIGLNGNIGIGTTAPSEKLHVNGLIKINGATNVDNDSPGIVLASNDDFLYDGQYINHYAFGFHGYQDGSTTHTEPGNAYMAGYFGVDFFTSGLNRMRISRDGIVSIGTVNRQLGYKLAVNGKVKAKEINVEVGWADFVFENNYNLPTLKEVEAHIKQKGHLKDIPSAKEVAENGIFLGEMDSKLLQKIEELTLYAINQEKRIKSLESKNEKLISLVEKLLEKTSEE